MAVILLYAGQQILIAPSSLGTALLTTDNTRMCREGLKCQYVMFTQCLLVQHDICVCTSTVGCDDLTELVLSVVQIT